MKTPNVKTKSLFKKIIEDKRAIRKCILKNGNLKKLRKISGKG